MCYCTHSDYYDNVLQKQEGRTLFSPPPFHATREVFAWYKAYTVIHKRDEKSDSKIYSAAHFQSHLGQFCPSLIVERGVLKIAKNSIGHWQYQTISIILMAWKMCHYSTCLCKRYQFLMIHIIWLRNVSCNFFPFHTSSSVYQIVFSEKNWRRILWNNWWKEVMPSILMNLTF